MKLNEQMPQINPESFLSDYLRHSGITDLEEYLNPSGANLEPPSGYLNIHKAYECLLKYMGEKALFVTDCDVDGFCASAIILNFCSKYLNIEPHILLHKGKQHGLTDDEIIQEIKDNPKDLLILTDAGSNDIERCKELITGGYVKDILILDHHQIQKGNPHAIVVNNQSKFNKDITNKALSGAGVTYKFIQYFCEENGMEVPYYFDLVATSIVADVCDLTTLENRTITYHGLNNIDNECLNEMWRTFSMAEDLVPDVIAWDIAPKINSLCRIENQELKMQLLLAMADLDEEINYSVLLKNLKSSKDKQDRAVKKIAEKYTDAINSTDKLVIIEDNECPKGQTGLVANKIMGKINKPVLFVHKDNDYYVGSGRSPIPINKILNSSKLFEFNAGKFIA